MGAQTSPRFDMRSRAGAQTNPIDPVAKAHDGRWPSPVSLHAAGKVLAALASHADQRKLTCWPAVETLARERRRFPERGVQYALRKLETAGAILEQSYPAGRSSSLYRLMIAPNPARIAPPNRARIALVNPARIAPQPRQGLRPLNRGKDCAPNRVIFMNRVRENRVSSSSKSARVRRQAKRQTMHQPHLLLLLPLIDSSSPTSKSETGRHTCPKCAKTWPQHYGPVCFKCQCDVERARHDDVRVSQT